MIHTLDRPAAVPTLPEADSIPAVVFNNVSYAYGDNVVLRNVSFSIPEGGMCIMLGPSGAGKTTILKLILALIRPDEGAVFVGGHRVDDMSEADLMPLRAGIGMVFQENALFDSLTVAENVGYRFYDEGRLSEKEIRARVDEVLGFVGLTEYVDRMPSELSGGQRRRVAIARAMASRPGLLLCDDPITGLDPVIARSVDDHIVKLCDHEHVTCIVTTHQIRDAFYIATHAKSSRAEFMVLHSGDIQFRGTAAELLASSDAYLRRFLYMTLPPW